MVVKLYERGDEQLHFEKLAQRELLNLIAKGVYNKDKETERCRKKQSRNNTTKILT